MYVFGVDIPLIELILAVGVVGVIILLEITIILILITFHMKNSKKLENQIGVLISKLMTLEGQELKEIDKLHDLAKQEKGILSRLKKFGFKAKKPEKPLTPKQRKKLYKQMSKPKKKNVLIDSVDKFLKRWKK